MNTLDNSSEIKVEEIIEIIKQELLDDKAYNITYLNIIIENFKNHPKILEIIPAFAELIYNNLDESITSIIGTDDYKKLYSKYYECMSLFEIRALIPSKTDNAIALLKEYVNECEGLFESLGNIVSAEGYIEYVLNDDGNNLYECGLNISKAYTCLAYLCVEKNEHEEAKEYLTKALEYNRFNAGALFEYAEIFKLDGDIEQYYSFTSKIHNKIYKIADLAHYYRNLGFYFIEKKDYKLAKALFNYSYIICETKMAENELKYIAVLTNDDFPLGMSKFDSEEMLRKFEINPSFSETIINELKEMQKYLHHFYVLVVEDVIKTHKILSFNHSESKYCVECGKVIPSNKKTCPFCGESQQQDPDSTCCLCDCGGSFGYTDKYCYACGKEIIRKSPEDIKKSSDLLYLEENIFKLKVSQNKEERSFILIQILSVLSKVQLIFPTEIDVESMLGNVDLSSLKKGDIITNSKDVKMNILTINSNGENVVPAFTSSEEINKGPDTSSTKMYFDDYYPIIKKMNNPIVINPFGESLYLSLDLLDIVKEHSWDNDEKKVESNDDCVGLVLNGKYELLKKIGQGGSFSVYLAIDKRVNKNLAVKVAKKTIDNFNSVNRAVFYETEMLKDLNHPAIPKIIDVVVEDDIVAIVQDYIEGKTLDSIITEYGRQDVSRIIDWSIQICDVLEYLHSLNPPHIYRDMKPANVILKPNGTISLVDFSIMRTYKPNSLVDTVALGTSGFAPPEQFGSAQTDCRSDIYALGMTIYSLYVGKKPNKGDNFDFGNENNSLNKGLVSIIKKCTELNPNDRYQSCSELKNELKYLSKKGKLKKKFGLFSKG